MLRKYLPILFLGIFLSACGWNLNAPDDENGENGDGGDNAKFRNATSSALPNLTGNTNTAKAVDLDADGDLDITLAIANQANKVLINNGSAVFADQSNARLSSPNYDSQDIAVADFNTDGFLDLFFANGLSQPSELYINNGGDTFSDLSNRIPVSGNFTTVQSWDIDGDGSMDMVIGSAAQNILLLNSGNAFFSDQTTQRLPQISDNTYDLIHDDVTGDGLWDIIVANEGANLLLVNTGSGYFSNQSANRIPNSSRETRDVQLVDIDNDGDFDIFFGNTAFQTGANPQDRLLINNGQGFFSDQTADRLPEITANTYDAEFADLDSDGDFDLIIGNYDGGLRVLTNNGNGSFEDPSKTWIPENFTPLVTDLEMADFNNDGRLDIYVATRNGQDQLLLQKELQ
jgi:hypothetical protein